jgi:hypothetical protein
MKKIVSLALVFGMIAALGCGGSSTSPTKSATPTPAKPDSKAP